MSWLHCMWGIGTMISPMVMGRVLAGGGPWTSGYRYIALFQILLSAVLFFSLPLWQSRTAGTDTETASTQALSLGQVFRLPGAREVMLCFFCYCALETTAGLWASSYLTLTKGVAAGTAASFASLFYIGITAGRAACGFLTLKFNDTQMIRMGQCILAAGVLALLLPGPQILALSGLVLVGLGCAPIYPSIIHSTPEHFGADRSQAVIGIQMASAYFGQSGHAAAVRPAGKQHHSGTVPFLPAGTAGAHGIHARTAGAQNKLLLILPFSYFIYSKRLPVRSRAGSLLF